MSGSDGAFPIVPAIQHFLRLLEAGPREQEFAAEHQLAGGRVDRAEVARRGRESLGDATLQGQGVAGQAIEFDPQLAGQQAADKGRPQAGAGRRVGGPHRRAHGRAAQTGNLALGGRGGLCAGEGAERTHAAFSARMLSA